jgi:hypothetical protein
MEEGNEFEVAEAAGFESGRVKRQDHASFFLIGQGGQNQQPQPAGGSAFEWCKTHWI